MPPPAPSSPPRMLKITFSPTRNSMDHLFPSPERNVEDSKRNLLNLDNILFTPSTFKLTSDPLTPQTPMEIVTPENDPQPAAKVPEKPMEVTEPVRAKVTVSRIKCDFCDKTYSAPGYLKKHLKAKHLQ